MMKMPVLGTMLLCLLTSAHGSELAGEKRLRLVDGEGSEIDVGTVRFTQAGDTARYEIDWAYDKFGEYFLSMRPFKCLEGPEKLWCRVPYPYEIRREVSAEDLTDLEYDTLFIWKKASEYGINMWNGVYYRFEMTDEGLIGTLHEIDMDVLSAPPDDGNLRPVGEFDIELGDAESHWLPELRIQ